jgi:hypothetical protein
MKLLIMHSFLFNTLFSDTLDIMFSLMDGDTVPRLYKTFKKEECSYAESSLKIVEINH